MIAYNRESLDNLAVNDEAARAWEQNLITQDEAVGIAQAYPVNFYSPNIFIRIGLFLLTAVIILMAFGLFALVSMGASELGWGLLTTVFSLVTYGALEMVIRERKHYRSGIDDAMMWASMIFMIAAVNIFSGSMADLEQAGLVFVLSAYYTLRFGNLLMACLVFGSFLAVVFYGLAPMGNMAKTVMPFLLMAISLAVYWIMTRYKNREQLRHYTNCCTCVEILALVVLYVAGNYYVVREVSNSMFDLHLRDGETIPGGWVFWVLTVVIPVVYIVRGVQKKNVILLRTGLLLVAGIVFTVRYYYDVMPLEIVMTIGGAILIVFAYGVTKYLTPPKYGFTHAEVNNGNLLELESLVVAETFGEAAPEEKRFEFGGGTGGGAGASGEY